jgi:hypothetical protein
VTVVDPKPPFEGPEEDALQANQYLGRGVAKLVLGAFGSELTPSSEDCLTPGQLMPAEDTVDEHEPSLTDVMPPTALPDVRRALERLRAGKSVQPGANAERVRSELGTPSGSTRPTDKPSRRTRAGENPWWRRIAVGVLAGGGWAAAGALTYLHLRVPNARFMAPAAPAPAARTVPLVLSAHRAESGPETEPMASELTPEAWLGLARQRARMRGEELKALASRIDGGERPPADAIAKLREAASDPQAAPEALFAMTAVAGALGPDLIHSVASDQHLSGETRKLAADLLGTKAVQARVSEALRVVLDLEQVQTCDQAEQVLGRVLEVGDRRALPGLRALYRNRGCGPQQADDCYPCLRKTPLLNQSVAMVRQRRPPF